MCDLEGRLDDRRRRNTGIQINSVEELMDEESEPLIKENTNGEGTNAAWYLDSGASNHTTGDRSVFSSLYDTRGQKLRSVGGRGHDVTGIGNVAIRLPSGEIQSINHVLSPQVSSRVFSP